jgi:hypothetical protein
MGVNFACQRLWSCTGRVSVLDSSASSWVVKKDSIPSKLICTGVPPNISERFELISYSRNSLSVKRLDKIWRMGNREQHTVLTIILSTRTRKQENATLAIIIANFTPDTYSTWYSTSSTGLASNLSLEPSILESLEPGFRSTVFSSSSREEDFVAVFSMVYFFVAFVARAQNKYTREKKLLREKEEVLKAWHCRLCGYTGCTVGHVDFYSKLQP